MPKLNERGPACRQAGVAHIFLLLALLAGIAAGVVILRDPSNLYSLFRPKASSGANVVFVSSSGDSIIQTDTAAVKVKLTTPEWVVPAASAGSVCKRGINSYKVGNQCPGKTFKSASYICYDGYSGTINSPICVTSNSLYLQASQACQNHTKCYPNKSVSPIPVTAVSATLAEDPNFTINVKTASFSAQLSSLTTDYTFSNSSAGTKVLYVKFKASNGSEQKGSPYPATISLGCSSAQIWNGSKCKSVIQKGDTFIVGLDEPVKSRAELDEIERGFVKKSFSNFPEELFNPTSQQLGQKIQDIRLANFRQIGTDYERTLEFVINSDVKNILDSNSAKIGGDAVTVLIKHAQAISNIWANSSPKINRKATLKRIMIVSKDVLSTSGGGWQVKNDHSFGWWANDTINGVKGFIPYDIDSRWAMDEGWPDCCLLNNPSSLDGIRIDYGLLHEITHHFPVGDNYVYNSGRGHGFLVPQPNNKASVFSWNLVNFMPNDHMSGPSSPKLTAPSGAFILFNWGKNPTTIRSAQDTPYPAGNSYGIYYFDNLTIKLQNLASSGVDGCIYLREAEAANLPASSPYRLAESNDKSSISYSNGECTLVLSKQQQQSAFPGGYIGLVRSGVVFPVFIPRNLMETFYWLSSLKQASLPGSFVFTMQATSKLKDGLDYFAYRINNGSGDIDMGPSKLVAFMDTSNSGITPSTILSGAIDDNNQYLIEYKDIASVPSPASSATPTPSPSSSPTSTNFTDLSAVAYKNSTVFNFKYSGESTSLFKVNLSTTSDMSWDVYGDFATGVSSPVTISNPSAKWAKYTCGKQLYWKTYNADGSQSSPIQSLTVDCSTPFVNLSSKLASASATFNFAPQVISSMYRIDLSTTSDMSWDVYLNFVFGTNSPITLANPNTRWVKYACGTTLYWKISNSDRTDSSPIQSATVTCP